VLGISRGLERRRLVAVVKPFLRKRPRIAIA
jgi:hypothetical protein